MKRMLSALLALTLLAACLGALAEPALEIPGLVYESTMPLRYAREFRVDYFEGGCKLLSIGDGNRYLIVPEGGEVPSGLAADIRVLRQPLDNIYLAASASMALFSALDALDCVKLSALQENAWYIDAAVEAMRAGEIVYAGKYSAPDYELLVQSGCDLAIESTMILHTPEVQEMIELLGIPVFIEHSSYEDHPLARTEWIKLYAAMVNKEAEAEAFFDRQAQVIEDLKDFPNTGRTVAFFYISSDGSVVVRGGDDYVARMIGIAGGRYVFDEDAGVEADRSSVSITMESFYAAAVDADYLIYNATIADPLDSLDDLLAKDALFADFKAVKEGHVWCTGKSLYQATDIVGQLITDFNRMLRGDEEGLTFIYKLN